MADTSALLAYRDDGPLATVAGRILGSTLRLPAVLLTVTGAVPLVVVLAANDGINELALGLATGWFVLLAGIASAQPHTGSLGWLVPPMLRAVEYGYLLRITVLSEPNAVPVCFALLAVLAYHHYDIVYRLRHQQISPPMWVGALGGGWDGRLLAAYVFAVAGGLREAMATAAVVLAAVYLVESTVGWLRFSQAQRPALYEDEQDEDE
ncbi:MAG: hypothetical protein QOG53_1919 [Frankiales bacterium]|jgi:hypothetical protein|nr:hypothetical protein [Frankiales bacterium]